MVLPSSGNGYETGEQLTAQLIQVPKDQYFNMRDDGCLRERRAVELEALTPGSGQFIV